MTLQALLADAKVSTVLIVDDAYDDVPLAADLASDDDAWANFFADLGTDRALVAAAFPDFERMDASGLRRSDAFVGAVWGLRGTLKAELWGGLFERYARDVTSDLDYLKKLEEALRALGLEPTPCGRSLSDEARRAPIVLADLFLGSPQNEEAFEESIRRLKDLLAGREADPPLVVLMSRSTRLADKKAEFRDRACLLGAMFRVHSKSELLEGKTLERTLERLVRHREDAVRLARFIHAWDQGLTAAKARFLTTIRRLDLADYGQINGLLLEAEGQPLGSYLLDVLDRVLQYEIEASPETIKCAEALNAIDPRLYPPPYLPGSPDLQDFVYRSSHQHSERLNVGQGQDSIGVSFGDILIERVVLETAAASGSAATALVALTPPCDLVRGAAKRVLFMVGAFDGLTPDTWSYSANPVRTPILVLPDSRRGQVRWDPKDLRTLLPAELTAMLAAGGSHVVVGRLRESQALALQQRLLSELGRVGLVAQMPASFSVRVEVSFLDAGDALQRLPLPALERDGGVYYVGRDNRGNSEYRLVLGQNACDELLDAVQGLDPANVHERARPALARLKTSTTLPALLDRGLDAPRPDQLALLEIRTETSEVGGQPKVETVGLIGRDFSGGKLLPNQEKHGALVIVMKLSPQPNDGAGAGVPAGN
jgi:hypothetical protein